MTGKLVASFHLQATVMGNEDIADIVGPLK